MVFVVLLELYLGVATSSHEAQVPIIWSFRGSGLHFLRLGQSAGILAAFQLQ